VILESASVFALATVVFIGAAPPTGVRRAAHGRHDIGERRAASPAQPSGASGSQTPKPGGAAPGGG
jgi:hypothetical protein